MSSQLDQIWLQVDTQLGLLVDEPTYRIWLQPLQVLELADDVLRIGAPVHAHPWIRERFGKAIQASVELVLGGGVGVEIVAMDSPAPVSNSTNAEVPGAPATGHALQTASSFSHASHTPASGDTFRNPKLTFGQFVIGDCNRLAHAAALAVAEMPSHAYNPLFLYGQPGVGKTHLLGSIANLLLIHNPELTVRCTTGESFTNEFLGALTGGHTDAFKHRYRDVDVLLVDDVQFLERKAKTEEEFFHTFNALHDSGRQLVLSSDRCPQDLQALEDRLRERFEAGLVADIQLPDLATRLAILRKRVQHDNIELKDDTALIEIAHHITSNVRTLEGALIRVVAFSSLTGRPISLELTREVLEGLYPDATSTAQRRRTAEDIQKATCELFCISPEELTSSSRASRVAWPRQLAMYLTRELTHESLPAIGRRFGGRDHTTVLHACRRAAKLISTNPESQQHAHQLQELLRNPQQTPLHPSDRAS